MSTDRPTNPLNIALLRRLLAQPVRLVVCPEEGGEALVLDLCQRGETQQCGPQGLADAQAARLLQQASLAAEQDLARYRADVEELRALARQAKAVLAGWGLPTLRETLAAEHQAILLALIQAQRLAIELALQRAPRAQPPPEALSSRAPDVGDSSQETPPSRSNEPPR